MVIQDSNGASLHMVKIFRSSKYDPFGGRGYTLRWI